MDYENQDGLFVEWKGQHVRFDGRKDDVIDFAMWDCEPTTFTHKDLEVTMVAYNEDCARKDKIISDQTAVVEDQTRYIEKMLNKITMLEKEKEEKKEKKGVVAGGPPVMKPHCLYSMYTTV
tara:strand:- start:95 stop:457 length:363 start_codon:yes stop_codon:yes gene_type:complete